MSWGVSTAVGSSRISTVQSWNSALTISTRCRSPIESDDTSRSGSMLTPTRSIVSSTRRLADPASTRPSPTPDRATFSVTVIVSTSENSWVTMPMPAAIASRGDPMSRGRPSMRMEPWSGRTSP
jgi:hypothetical protein